MPSEHVHMILALLATSAPQARISLWMQTPTPLGLGPLEGRNLGLPIFILCRWSALKTVHAHPATSWVLSPTSRKRFSRVKLIYFPLWLLAALPPQNTACAVDCPHQFTTCNRALGESRYHSHLLLGSACARAPDPNYYVQLHAILSRSLSIH